MCQQYENERQFIVRSELEEIKRAWELHKSGEKILTEEEIRDLVVRKIMLED